MIKKIDKPTQLDQPDRSDKIGNQELKKAGLKTTVPRLKILHILEELPNHHLSAEEIYRVLLESNDDVGIATVYRVLTQFEAAGLVVRHNFSSGHSVFELNVGSHHDHIVCIKCGKVEEFVDPLIERQQEAIAKQHNFQMTEHSLTIYGLCQECRVD